MYKNGLGYYEITDGRPVAHSIAPAAFVTLLPSAGLSGRGLAGVGLGCPGLGCPGLGALSLPSFDSLSASVPSWVPGGALGLGVAAVAGYFLWRSMGKKRGGSSSRAALRRAAYKAQAERAAILAKA